MKPQNCRVALLVGGLSNERDISLASGNGAQEALEEAGYQVTSLDIARREDLRRLLDEEFDVAFMCLHGKYGEDGCIQGMLELIGLPYTGSDVFSSAIAMDKSKSKLIYELNGLKTPPSQTLLTDDLLDESDLCDKIGMPCVVKPARAGSALGIHIVHEPHKLKEALQDAFSVDDEIIIERYISGIEVTVAVMGNAHPYALPVIEIIPINEFYDYEAKYAPGGSQHICPARLTDKQTSCVQEAALRAHKALECSGVSRSDFIIDDNDTVWILETNTLPGMTQTSLLPDAGRAAGKDFSQLCTELINCAFEKANSKKANRL